MPEEIMTASERTPQEVAYWKLRDEMTIKPTAEVQFSWDGKFTNCVGRPTSEYNKSVPHRVDNHAKRRRTDPKSARTKANLC